MGGAVAEERAVFLREQANSMYGVGSYFLSKTAVSFPLHIIFSLVFSLLIYFMMGVCTPGLCAVLIYGGSRFRSGCTQVSGVCDGGAARRDGRRIHWIAELSFAALRVL